MTWNEFPIFASVSACLWMLGTLMAFLKKPRWAIGLSILGSLFFLVFIISIWINVGRPPMRTIGETRLWYSLFLSVIGIIIYIRYRYNWMLGFTTLMAVVFLMVNIFKPEIHDQYLMPALQSPWFIPHVIVYMIAYALMGAAAVWSIYLWVKGEKGKREGSIVNNGGLHTTLMRISWAFLTLGIVMGALWAKQAWGDWWSWDPKETWAAATWFSCLLYMHINSRLRSPNTAYALILFTFLLLQICWYGVNYLPSAQGASMHTY